jgi:hypothetical protein
MFQYRQVLVRMRQGDSDRDIARSKLMGRPKAAALYVVAHVQEMTRDRHNSAGANHDCSGLLSGCPDRGCPGLPAYHHRLLSESSSPR